MGETALLKLTCDLCKKTETHEQQWQNDTFAGWRRISVMGIVHDAQRAIPTKILCADCLGKCGLA